jgi:predicted regulator of Ras-like GTPase activity (Roadblock/LC7/MglB family)
LVRQGRIFGLMLCDADARVLACDPLFDCKISTWDLAALAAASFGVAKQARLFFDSLGAKELERGSFVFDGLQLFVAQAGRAKSEASNRERELLLVVLAGKDANFGLITLQMKKYAPQVEALVAEEGRQHALDLTERDLHLFLAGGANGGMFH